MNKVLTIFLLVFFGTLKGQSYKPIPLDTNHYWSEVFSGWQGPTVLISSLYRYKIKDTVILSINYKKVLCDNPFASTAAWGRTNIILRQDSIQKKVFVLINNQEHILYNFNKILGDTLTAWDLQPIAGPSGMAITTTVTAVDSVLLLDNKYHKRFRYGNWNYAIEGVGGMHGLLSPYFTVFETEVQLVCMGTINSTLTTVYMNPGYIQAGCLPYVMGNHAIENSANIRLFPNPVTDQLHISNIENRNFDYKLVNLLGDLIPLNKIITNKPNTSFDVRSLPKGIYFLQVFENNQLISVEKIIKE